MSIILCLHSSTFNGHIICLNHIRNYCMRDAFMWILIMQRKKNEPWFCHDLEPMIQMWATTVWTALIEKATESAKQCRQKLLSHHFAGSIPAMQLSWSVLASRAWSLETAGASCVTITLAIQSRMTQKKKKKKLIIKKEKKPKQNKLWPAPATNKPSVFV